VLYALVFGVLLGRPLSYGFLERQIDAKLARAASIAGPKLVILAGSNAAYSHRCETIEQALALPCVNGGVAVGLGLDYEFARWARVLRAGDVLYLPMEQEQYAMTRAATRLGPDAAIMLRDDRATLAGLAPDRWAAALFSTDLRGALMAALETALVAAGFDGALRATAEGGTNAWGDHVGHTPALGAPIRAVLAAAHPSVVSAEAVRAGYGAALIADFAQRMAARGVTVVGGLATGFADAAPSEAAVAAIRAVYEAHGAAFLALPDRSLYPRADFFDTPEHLSEPCQIAHSRLVAAGLAALLGRVAQPVADAGEWCPVPPPPGPLPSTLAYDAPNMTVANRATGQE